MRYTMFVSAIMFAAPSMVQAIGFVNGDFETGDLSGWTITPTENGMTLFEQVVMFDVTGDGRLANAANFSVGQVNFEKDVPAGIDMTQTLLLKGGVKYSVTFDWAVFRDGINAEGGIFSVVVDGELFGTQQAGPVQPGGIIRGSAQATFLTAESGEYEVGVRITRPYNVVLPPSPPMNQYVDNVAITLDDSPVPGDLNEDGVVDVFDLLILLQWWGECPPPQIGLCINYCGEMTPPGWGCYCDPLCWVFDDCCIEICYDCPSLPECADEPHPCPADLNGDWVVDVFDLLILLGNWG